MVSRKSQGTASTVGTIRPTVVRLAPGRLASPTPAGRIRDRAPAAYARFSAKDSARAGMASQSSRWWVGR